ncbi:uncharacterized protein LTR77_004344 [Saxophila tyrrhenica]|uniref:F-box domain-containing protein n=1 Tax=Saxophila tyrrhenica TaxID=1690608 RepID=A0AAV9PGT4_9PEZI|nr:hypothetical protein LTR77_004344 [Saxophila tyrrhenica]
MDRLPEEVVLHIISFLDILDIVNVQSVSHRYLLLGRDNALWKTETFSHSRAEALRRQRHLLNAQDSRLSELRNAFSALPGGDLTPLDVALLRGSPQPRASSDPQAEARTQRHRALVNWEPDYAYEDFDYYEEYIHRHGPISLGWLKDSKHARSETGSQAEATGLATLSESQSERPAKVVAPLADGSISIWDIGPRSAYSSSSRGRLVGQSKRGLLTGRPESDITENHTMMTETGAVESVAVDSTSQKGYFAVQSLLQEVDLTTMQLVSTKQYPFPITALSEANGQSPITVGTNNTVHLYDPRDPAFITTETATSGELIGGSVYSHATLAQPGSLSILHHDSTSSDDSSIWVAGRFTSLLNYDRRFFPRLRGTLHSGARIASMAFSPFNVVARELDLVRNPDASISSLLEARSHPGPTILAAAEYKGKGSLELHNVSSGSSYQNRQTASASKLLSAAPHGGRIVFSDGDGNLKWVEKDGFSYVRTFNIQPPPDAAGDASDYGIWSSTASEMPGQGDIVQKILPLKAAASTASDNRADINQSNLLLWTGDGALGMLGFGYSDALGVDDDWHDAVEARAQTVEQRAKEDAERQYGMAMRRALERNADEVRFVRGLGMMR